MEAIDRFDIDLDLTEREAVYDYVSCREYTRPEGGWDYGVFRGIASLACIDEHDENSQLRVELMDKSISDKRLLEKKCKTKSDRYVWSENTDDNEGSRLPRRVIPVYRSGDIIKGTIRLALNKPVEANAVVVTLMGWSFVKVRVYTGKGYADVYGDEKFVRETRSVWERTDAKGDSAGMSLLSSDGPARSSVLAATTHCFPFEFALPADLPQSTPPMVISSHNKGFIVYRIKAAIDKKRLHHSGNIVIHKGLLLRKDVDIATNPSNLDPVEYEETLETGTLAFWKSGSINVRASLKSKGCIRGEPVPIRIEINNQSKGDIKAISACIRMYGKARERDHWMTAYNNINIKSVKVKEGPVAAGMCPVYNWSLPWDFHESSVDGNLLPVGDLNDSILLDINYEVRIQLKRAGLHRDMELNIPIFVGSINSRKAIE